MSDFYVSGLFFDYHSVEAYPAGKNGVSASCRSRSRKMYRQNELAALISRLPSWIAKGADVSIGIGVGPPIGVQKRL